MALARLIFEQIRDLLNEFQVTLFVLRLNFQQYFGFYVYRTWTARTILDQNKWETRNGAYIEKFPTFLFLYMPPVAILWVRKKKVGWDLRTMLTHLGEVSFVNLVIAYIFTMSTMSSGTQWNWPLYFILISAVRKKILSNVNNSIAESWKHFIDWLFENGVISN